MAKKMYSFENFDININDGSLEVLLWSVYAGIIVGVGSSLLYRVYTHSFVDAVIKAGALDEDHAVTLGSLDFRGKWYIKRQLRAGSAGSLSRMFVFTNADTFPKKKCTRLGRFWREKFLGDEIPPEIPFDTAKLYLPEERRVAAELRFTEEKAPLRTFLLSAVLLAVVIAAATVAVPELMTMLDNLVTQLTPRGNVI